MSGLIHLSFSTVKLLIMTSVYYVGALILLMNFSFYCHATSQNNLESHMILLLEKWRTGHFSSDIVPLPPLKSVKIPDAEYSYDGKGIKMTYILHKMELTGLDTFTVKKLTIAEANTTLKMSISLNIPKLILYAENYELSGHAYYLYPLKGSGNMTVIGRGNNVSLDIRLETAANGISTQVKDFQFNFDIYQIEANLVNSSWPINKILNSEGVTILDSYHHDIVQAMWHYIVPYMNHHLVNLTIREIVGMILNTTL